jgi:hypothetical protein
VPIRERRLRFLAKTVYYNRTCFVQGGAWSFAVMVELALVMSENRVLRKILRLTV